MIATPGGSLRRLAFLASVLWTGMVLQTTIGCNPPLSEQIPTFIQDFARQVLAAWLL